MKPKKITYFKSNDTSTCSKENASGMLITETNSKELSNIIDTRKPLGLFLSDEGSVYVAVDNSTGDAWTEEFASKNDAVRWLTNPKLIIGIDGELINA